MASLFPPFDASRLCAATPTTIALELMTQDHAPDLARIVRAGDIWRNPYTHIPAPAQVVDFITRALDDSAKGGTRAFVVYRADAGGDKNNQSIVGCTRFFHLSPQHRRVQIGGTWLAASARRTGVNRTMKWLLLREAFEVMGLQRVEFCVHPENIESRSAMLRLGATFEGVLRQHLFVDNKPRDTAMYSVVRDDWLKGLPI